MTTHNELTNADLMFLLKLHILAENSMDISNYKKIAKLTGYSLSRVKNLCSKLNHRYIDIVSTQGRNGSIDITFLVNPLTLIIQDIQE